MSKKELLFSFRKDDFEVEWFSGTGGGGQYRNRHKNCCRIRHKESGLVASCQEQRSAAQNKKKAFRKLVKLLVEHYAPKEEKTRGSLQEQHTRTYNESKNYVKDHISNKKYSYSETVGRGDISQIVQDRIKHIDKTK